MRGGAVAGWRRRGHPPDGASCSMRAGLQQCKSFVEICIVSCLSAEQACVPAPTVAGCRLVDCSVVSGRALRSRAVAGVSLHVCVCLGPVLASHAQSQPAAAAAAWQGRGLVPIAGWSCGGVGPERGLRGRRGWCEEWARRG